MNTQLYAIHGFLGKKEDWKTIDPRWKAIDPYAVMSPTKNHGLNEWGEAFNKQTSGQENFLLGYSLGGRLALHALLHQPQRWKGAILISTHPGLAFEEQRLQRTLDDAKWAKNFEEKPWEPLMKAWNAQPVFKSDIDLQRQEKDYCRKQLADTLRFWSLGRQPFLLPQLKTLPMPILWIVGGHDTTQLTLSQRLIFTHPNSKVSVAPEVGHRVPWDNISFFKKTVEDFIHDCIH